MTRQPFSPRETVISNLAKIGFKDITGEGWFNFPDPDTAYFDGQEEIYESLTVYFDKNEFLYDSGNCMEILTEESEHPDDARFTAIKDALYGAKGGPK